MSTFTSPLCFLWKFCLSVPEHIDLHDFADVHVTLDALLNQINLKKNTKMFLSADLTKLSKTLG